MNYADIKYCDVANGKGVRVSLFVSGCTHHCKGCFNEETWNFHYGKPFTEETEKQVLDYLDKSYIAGLSLLGGEPFEHVNQQGLLPLLIFSEEWQSSGKRQKRCCLILMCWWTASLKRHSRARACSLRAHRTREL